MARRERRRKIVRIIQKGKMPEKEGNYTREGGSGRKEIENRVKETSGGCEGRKETA